MSGDIAIEGFTQLMEHILWNETRIFNGEDRLEWEGVQSGANYKSEGTETPLHPVFEEIVKCPMATEFEVSKLVRCVNSILRFYAKDRRSILFKIYNTGELARPRGNMRTAKVFTVCDKKMTASGDLDSVNPLMVDLIDAVHRRLNKRTL